MLEAYKTRKLLDTLETRLDREAVDVMANVRELLKEQPSNDRAQFILGRCQVLLDEPDMAKKTFGELVERAPGNVQAKVELARIHHGLKDAAAAIGLLRKATEDAPEVAETWRLLAKYLRQDGQERAGGEARRQFDMIKAFNGSLQAAETACANGDFKLADQKCRNLLQKVPGEIRTLRILAKIAWQMRYYEAGREILERCLESRPDDPSLRLDYAQALLAGKKYREALVECDRVTDLAPEVIDIYEVQAEALYNLGQYEEAMEIFRELSSVEEKRPLSLVHLGKVLTTVGETDQAIECFRAALAEQSTLGQAWWELASLKTYRFTAAEIETMEQLKEDGKLPGMDKILVQFALGRALEDDGRHAESFEHIRAGNAAYAKYHPPRYVSRNDDLKAFFMADYFATQKDRGNESRAPIFIVGMPRSGSTLVEQILSSHSEVDATTELTEIISIAREIGGSNQPGQGKYPGALADLTVNQLQNYAQRYLDFAQPLRRGGDFFLDKTPGNFHHIGLIKTLFPNAKIIDARRNPMASGWSLYKHFFADSFLYSYDLKTIGEYYNDYVELMDHWHTVLPGQILTLQYEDLVNDLPAAVDKLLRYCSLPFERGCLDFHQNRRAVSTPSSEQVRSPLYRSALDHWENYWEFLEPLRQVVDKTDPVAG